ncbi:hypothetical protein Tco_1035143 [Tanacetum coccineum]
MAVIAIHASVSVTCCQCIGMPWSINALSWALVTCVVVVVVAGDALVVSALTAKRSLSPYTILESWFYVFQVWYELLKTLAEYDSLIAIFPSEASLARQRTFPNYFYWRSFDSGATGPVVAAGLTVVVVGASVAGVVAVEKKWPFVEEKFALKSDVAHDCMHEGAYGLTIINELIKKGTLDETLAGIVVADDNVTEDQPRLAILRVSLLHYDNKEVEVILSDDGSSQKVTP